MWRKFGSFKTLKAGKRQRYSKIRSGDFSKREAGPQLWGSAPCPLDFGPAYRGGVGSGSALGRYQERAAGDLGDFEKRGNLVVFIVRTLHSGYDALCRAYLLGQFHLTQMRPLAISGNFSSNPEFLQICFDLPANSGELLLKPPHDSFVSEKFLFHLDAPPKWVFQKAFLGLW